MLQMFKNDGVGIRLVAVVILATIALGINLSHRDAGESGRRLASRGDTVVGRQTTNASLVNQDEVSAKDDAAEVEKDAATVVPPTAGDASTENEERTAEETAEAVDLGVGYAFDNGFLFLCACLVLLMQAGFALVEVGMNSSRNAINILYKNLMDLCIGALLFYIVGFGLMYPALYGEVANGYFAFGGVGLYEGKADRTFAPEADWFFQAVFAATAATIVSGAVAGRMKFGAYLIYSAILTGFIYPISGYWKWGGGWLTQFGEATVNAEGVTEYSMAFQDFAGSAVVHAVGGFAGLAGAIILGSRTGRFVKGESRPMPGHNMVYAALGVFILWFGWYGFNPGSQLAFQGTGDIEAVMFIAVNTTLAAAAGGVVATMISWVFYRKPDLSLSLNGVLGGLVGITACCDCFTHEWAIFIGAVAGMLVIVGVVLLERAEIDDPVGAWPVHGLCGVWGCLAIGFLPNTHLASGSTSFLVQLIGTVSICGWSFLTMMILFLVLKGCGILRVSSREEEIGLDVAEHGMHAYYDTESRTGK